MENIKNNDYVVFANIDRIIKNEKYPFDFGIVVSCKKKGYNVRIIDKKSEFYNSIYYINNNDILKADLTDLKENFKYDKYTK